MFDVPIKAAVIGHGERLGRSLFLLFVRHQVVEEAENRRHQQEYHPQRVIYRSSHKLASSPNQLRKRHRSEPIFILRNPSAALYTPRKQQMPT